MSLSTVLIASPIDKWMDKQIENETKVDDDAGLKASLLIGKVDGEESIHLKSEEDIPADQVPVSVKDITKFSLIFWVLSLSCVVVYGTII